MKFILSLILCTVVQLSLAQEQTTIVAGARYLGEAGLEGAGIFVDDDYVTAIGFAPGIERAVTGNLTVGFQGHAALIAGRRFSGGRFGAGPRITFFLGRKMVPADTIRQGTRTRVVQRSQPVFYYVRTGFSYSRLQIDLEPPEPAVRMETDIGRLSFGVGALHLLNSWVGLFAEINGTYDHLLQIAHHPVTPDAGWGTGEITRAGVGVSGLFGVRMFW